MSAQSGRRQASSRRRTPQQARSQATVEFILISAARVFRREGFAATTNRIADVAGVSIGTLYEYFPNKHALLRALAEQHVKTAESELAKALQQRADPGLGRFLGTVQQAILRCHQYPSQALDLLTGDAIAADLQRRAQVLRQQVHACLRDCAKARDDADLRARAAFIALAELPARALYELDDPGQQQTLAALGLAMALTALGAEAQADHATPPQSQSSPP